MPAEARSNAFISHLYSFINITKPFCSVMVLEVRKHPVNSLKFNDFFFFFWGNFKGFLWHLSLPAFHGLVAKLPLIPDHTGVKDKLHLASEEKKLGESKSHSVVSAYSADFLCRMYLREGKRGKEMRQEYRLCLDGRFYFWKIIPHLPPRTASFPLFHPGDGAGSFLLSLCAMPVMHSRSTV